MQGERKGTNSDTSPSRADHARLRARLRRACRQAAEQVPPMPADLPGFACRKLCALTPGRRWPWLSRRPFLHRPEVIQALCRESDRAAGRDVALAESLARLALALVAQLGDKPLPALAADLEAESLAMLANAFRVQERYEEAADLWPRAQAIERQGTGDQYLWARLSDLHASLLRAMRQLPEAREVASRALSLFRSLDQPDDAFVACLNLSAILYAEGDVSRALGALTLRPATVGRELLTRHGLGLRHKVILYLAELGHTAEAWAELYEAAPLYEAEAPEGLKLQRRWIEGKLLMNLGSWREAGTAFAALRQRYLAAERPFDAALVGMDLLLCHAEQRDVFAAARLAEEILPVFSRLELPGETRTVLERLGEAARRFCAGAELVRQAYELIQPLRRLPPRWPATLPA